MRIQTLVAAAALALCTHDVLAQQHGASVVRAPREASQYDFLIGQWELTVKPKAVGLAARVHGVPKLTGTWKAWRALDGWGIEDELRIVDASGNPQALTHHVRVYDMSARRWVISAVDAYRQRVTRSTAQWSGNAMVVSGEGTDAEGKAYSTRTRITAVTPSSFRYQQDRSSNGGKSWDEATLVIEAKRVASVAPR